METCLTRALYTCVLCLVLIAPYLQAAEPGVQEFLYAQKLFDEKYYDSAAEQLERVLRDYPGMPHAGEAQYMLGEAWLLSGEFEKARAAFLKSAILYPESKWAPEALFKTGECLEKLGKTREAAQAYERVEGFYPGHRLAIQGLMNSMGIYITGGDTVAALAAIDRLMEKYPDSDAADAARLNRAHISLERGDAETARRYYAWVAGRTGSDSIEAVARLKLATLLEEQSMLDAAEAEYNTILEGDAPSHLVAQARLSYADLLNSRGLAEKAREVLQPLLSAASGENLLKARITAGDSYFIQGEYRQALQLYHQAGENPLAALKAAWTAERLVSFDTALDRYEALSRKDCPEGDAALLRAAELARTLGFWDRAQHLYSRLLSKSHFPDRERALLEAARVAAITGGDAAEPARRLLAESPKSPGADDAAWLVYHDSYLKAVASPEGNLTSPDALFAKYPASSHLDTARALFAFYGRMFKRSPDLIERMASLSSRQVGSVSPIKWASDWGSFYLDHFKDPVKAIDQFTAVLDAQNLTAAELQFAQKRIVEAYLLLYEAALWENDSTATAIYADSTRDNLNRLAGMEGSLTDWHAMRDRMIILDLRRLPALDIAERGESLDSLLMEMLKESQQFSPELIYAVLSGLSGYPDAQAVDCQAALEVVSSAITRTKDARLTAGLKWLTVKAFKCSGNDSLAVETAQDLSAKFADTPAGAAALYWLAESSELPDSTRLKHLIQFESHYPYLVEPAQTLTLKAELLETIGRHLAAFSAREEAAQYVEWSLPNLNIRGGETLQEPLDILKGRAWLSSGDWLQAWEAFRRHLNAHPRGEHAPEALLALASIKAEQGDIPTALAFIDTLQSRFPSSAEAADAIHLRAPLLMEADRYTEARKDWQALSAVASNPDSAVRFDAEAVVCLYRMNMLDDAHSAARELYKRHKDRDDLDNFKAQFYLEKGRANDRNRNFNEALEQYEIISDKYPFTEWVDDARFARGLSLLGKGNLTEAAAVLSRFPVDFPESELRWSALLTLGAAQYREGNYPEAAAALNRVWENTDASGQWRDAFGLLLRVYKDARFWDAGIRLTREYMTRFPDAEDLTDRKMDIGWFHMQIGDWDEAIRAYQPLLPMADAEMEAETQYYIGECYMSKGEYRSAILEFLKVRILGRKTKLDWGLTAIYKAGNCYEKLGDKEGAARMYRKIIAETGAASNYGITAQKRLDALTGK